MTGMRDGLIVGRERFAFWIIGTLLFVGVEAAAMLSGGDASWDLRNYHFYGPFALLNKPDGTDIAPAHMLSFLPPTLDLMGYITPWPG